MLRLRLANAKAGQVRYRTDKNGIIHGGIGKVDFEVNAVKGNLEALLVDLKKAKPASAKGHYVRKDGVVFYHGTRCPCRPVVLWNFNDY